MNKGLIYVKLMVTVVAFMAMSSRADVKLDVTNSLVLHLAADNIDAGDANQVRADSGSLYVKKWPDLSTNAFDATQTTNEWQPLYLASTPCHMPALHFDGTNDHMIVDEAAPMFETNYTLFVVCVHSRPTLYAMGAANASSTSHARNHGPSLTITTQQVAYIASPGGGERGDGMPSTQNVWYVHMFIYDMTGTGDFTFGMNGVLKSWSPAGSHGDSVLDTCTVGAYRRSGQMSGNAFMAGDISEIMLYNRPLSSPEIESAGTYLSEKYRIITAYWAPPKGAIITTR